MTERLSLTSLVSLVAQLSHTASPQNQNVNGRRPSVDVLCTSDYITSMYLAQVHVFS